MLKLTKQQVALAKEKARQLKADDVFDFSLILEELAPYLQLPWEPPTPEEIKTAQNTKGSDSHRRILVNFVNRRNIHRISSNKQVEIVANILSKHSVPGLAQSLAEDIIIALAEEA